MKAIHSETQMDLDNVTAGEVLNNGIEVGKKVVGCHEGRPFIFLPESPGVYHGFPAESGRDFVPNDVLKEWLREGKITRSHFNDYRKKQYD